MLSLLLPVLFSLLLGVVVTLLVQFYLLKIYFTSNESSPPKILGNVPFQLPQSLLQSIRSNSKSPENSAALNVLFQFLFHELRDTPKVRRWFRNKLTVEFEELITRTAIGKMFGSIKVRDISLGSEFPVINSVIVDDVKINEDFSHIDSVDLKLDISYKGGFQLVVDANMVLGKAAYLSIKVGELNGLGRLQFTRLPYSHWSFSFYEEPRLALEVESQFQGRPLPQITALISNQIRKSIRKKHTLPNYKLRYKPFFSATEETPAAEEVPASVLSLTLHHLSRLHETSSSEVYCLVGVDSIPWINILNVDGCSVYLLDVIVTKSPTKPLGITFKQEVFPDKNLSYILVESSSQSEVLPGDKIISVDGKRVTQTAQLPKMLKNSAIQVTLRVERRSLDLVHELGKPKASISGSDSSGSASLSGSPARPSSTELKRTLQKHSLLSSLDLENPVAYPRLITTKAKSNNQVVELDETVKMYVTSSDRYLNVIIRGVETAKQDPLLAYVNIPLSTLLDAADNMHNLTLKPPDLFAASISRSHLSGHNGFIPLLCYGMILLSAELKRAAGAPSPVKPEQPLVSERKHQFARTHLHSSTQCQFCGKKIWLKDAEQCMDCGMTCHKKCVVKCKSGTICTGVKSGFGLAVDSTIAGLSPALDLTATSPTSERATPESRRTSSGHPEIIMTSCSEPAAVSKSSPAAQGGARKGLSSLLASVASAGRGLKRVGSAHNLQLPGEDAQGDSGSRSLPPSPQQSPTCSRKPSLPLELSEDISALLQTLLQQGTDQGDMMNFAKATGKTLFEDLDLPQRKEKIQQMMNTLKEAIANEADVRLSLDRAEKSSKDATTKTKTAFLIGKSDEKTQALTVLMLHFCSGLQHIQDLEEQEKETMTIDCEGRPITD